MINDQSSLMETLTHEEEEEGGEQSADRSVKKTNVSFPIEIIEEILSRIPVRSILRSRSVSKPWLSLISHPSFTDLHFTRATLSHRTGLFISAYNVSTCKRYYFSAANEGGPLTRLMTIDNDVIGDLNSVPSHLKGLVFFTSNILISGKSVFQPFFVNPSTRRIYKLPLPGMNAKSKYDHISYLYGFDESTREHKILHIRKVLETMTFEFMIFSLSSYSWRKIDAEPPLGFSWDRLTGCLDSGVCVNGVVHLMIRDDILAFDFVTEKFSVINLPQSVLPRDWLILTKIDGCLGVVFLDKEMSELHIVLLQDYDKRVWVKETIKFPKSWNSLVYGPPLSIDVNMDNEIVFSLSVVSSIVPENVNMKIVHVYNRKSKCFKTLQFTLDDQFPSPKYLTFYHIKCYVESTMPLFDNWNITS